MNTATESVNEYHAQADAFLVRFGIKCRITLSNSKTAPWDGEHETPGFYRNHYRVTLSASKGLSSYSPNLPRRLVFDYWGSIADARANRHPHAYDVLASISMDSNTPDTFADFCAEYGYDADSIKALQTFRRAHAFAKRIRAFFTADELAALAEIR